MSLIKRRGGVGVDRGLEVVGRRFWQDGGGWILVGRAADGGGR